VTGLFLLWCHGALYFDLPAANLPGALAFLIGLVVLIIRTPGAWWKCPGALIAGLGVLAWWLTLDPPDDVEWDANVARTAWAEINGDQIIIHNVRNSAYPDGEENVEPRWETRAYDLTKLTGVDLFLNYWGTRWMAHPIASFQFEDSPPLCFSIEIRKQKGRSYSALRGLYRQYGLIYIPATEEDVIHLRTHVRKEEVFHHPLVMKPETVRHMLHDYLAKLNALHEEPKWYNAITMNCTTSIRAQTEPGLRAPWDWRILINGYMDDWLHERGMIDSGGLPFREFRETRRIDPDNPAFTGPDGYSEAVREGLK